MDPDDRQVVGLDGGEVAGRLGVDELPERYRSALTLYYYEERAVGEVAQMLGVPEGTIKTNLHRARALLLERLRALGLADPAQWLEGLA